MNSLPLPLWLCALVCGSALASLASAMRADAILSAQHLCGVVVVCSSDACGAEWEQIISLLACLLKNI